MSTTANSTRPSIARLRVQEVDRGVAVLDVSNTDYQLHLHVDNSFSTPAGKVVRGEIFAKALRMHRSDTGGRFIEPVYGVPRIVQGTVKQVDAANNRVLFDMVVPVWVTLESNSPEEFHSGEMWNCYVESGTRFVPAT